MTLKPRIVDDELTIIESTLRQAIEQAGPITDDGFRLQNLAQLIQTRARAARSEPACLIVPEEARRSEP